MTRSQLIALLAEKNDYLSNDEAEKVVDVFFDKISDSLMQGNRIELRGFGAFKVKTSKPRIGRNPRNGEIVNVATKKTPAFKIGKALFERMNKTENGK
ncbi:MAG: integration host factor subunit beta [Alphaproteobacteria bacterium]|nr:integration host factor subunit beta [Alphaproteobacteria bacterium]